MVLFRGESRNSPSPDSIHHFRNVRDCAFAQRGQVITAFQRGNQATLRVGVRQLAQTLRDPGVVVGLELQLRQRIVAMCVETSGNQQQLRAMRNRIAHVYDAIDATVVWRALAVRIPDLGARLLDSGDD